MTQRSERLVMKFIELRIEGMILLIPFAMKLNGEISLQSRAFRRLEAAEELIHMGEPLSVISRRTRLHFRSTLPEKLPEAFVQLK